MRRYMPVIAKRVNMTGGMVAHYFNGYGTSPEKYQVIIATCDKLLEEIDVKQNNLEAEAQSEQARKALGPPPPRDRKRKRQTQTL
jgi:hypothetical protein